MLTRGSLIVPRAKLAAVADDLDLCGLLMLLIAEALYRPGVAPDGTPLKPGQLVTGKRALAARCKRTESWCYRALKRLQERTLIELEANRDGTIVTICDWKTYTRLPKRREPRTDLKRPRNEPRPNRNRIAGEPLRRQKAEGRIQSPPTPQGERGGWEELIEELEALGVTQARKAASAAAAAGCSPDDFRPHLAYWKSHRELWASPEGVLYRRLEYLRLGQPTDEGWPPFDEAKQRERRRRDDDQRDRDKARRAFAEMNRLKAEDPEQYAILHEATLRRIINAGEDTSDPRVLTRYMVHILMSRPKPCDAAHA